MIKFHVIHRDLERSLVIFSKEISALIANKSIEYTLDLLGQLLAFFRPYEFFEQRNLIKAFKMSVTQIDQDSNPEILTRGDSTIATPITSKSSMNVSY